jgi:hypothetical protein
MDTLSFLRSAAKRLHKDLTQAVGDLGEAQLHFRPMDKGNPIAFMIWHCVRTEDIVVNAFLWKKPTVWDSEGWAQKAGVDAKGQGTGMPNDQAAALRIGNPKEFCSYMERAFQATDAYLEALQEQDLATIHDMPMLGKMSVLQTVGGVVLHHGAGHLGEIWYLKGLQGLKGSPI